MCKALIALQVSVQEEENMLIYNYHTAYTGKVPSALNCLEQSHLDSLDNW
jgi:hypothetical protein